jgi:L-fuconolactonase
MKIDSHQHFWKYNPADYGWINEEMKVLKRDFLPSDLEKELKTIDFVGSIAVQARQSLEETEWLLKLANENPIIKGVVGWVDLQSINVEKQLEEFSKNSKLVGVRHVVQDEADDNFMLRPAFINGLKHVQQFKLAYDILIFPKHLPVAAKLVSQFPDLQFVVDHIAKPFIGKKILEPWKTEIAEFSKFKNVSCKVSGMVTEADWHNWEYEDFFPYLDTIFENFGTQRILIGSDWPVCTVAGKYSVVMDIVLKYIHNFSKAEKDAILGGNAQKVYRIK